MPLRKAAERGFLNVVMYLYTVAHPTWNQEALRDAVRTATRCGHLPIVQFLVPNFVNFHGHENDEELSHMLVSLLQLASYHGHIEILRYLIEQLHPTNEQLQQVFVYTIERVDGQIVWPALSLMASITNHEIDLAVSIGHALEYSGYNTLRCLVCIEQHRTLLTDQQFLEWAIRTDRLWHTLFLIEDLVEGGRNQLNPHINIHAAVELAHQQENADMEVPTYLKNCQSSRLGTLAQAREQRRQAINNNIANVAEQLPSQENQEVI
jgi:hypothetical protein